MATCFIIQPFDNGPFDQRYEDVIAPAVKAADLEPYRVDRDPAASIPIDAIERGIRDAAVCLAEITTDNPNVWFELGYALACGKEVVMVCKKERGSKFPFDVQHRAIITYGTEAPTDFQKLRGQLTERLMAANAKGPALERLSQTPLQPAEGLAAHEQVCLAVVSEYSLAPDHSVYPVFIKSDMEKAGFTALAASMALRSLLKKGMVETIVVQEDPQEPPSTAYRISDAGQDWLETNQDKLVLRAPPRKSGKAPAKPAEDDIPF